MDVDSIVYADDPVPVPEAMDIMVNNADSDSDDMDSGDEAILQAPYHSGKETQVLITVFKNQLKVFSFTTRKSTANGLAPWPHPSNAV